ncbi:MAG: type II toxin-antitoxin system HicA family toxin [Saprospiraceae bacterium]|uniref:Type II toxin-antitoxin system HicA family toxin n=1 Tax=Candidatus Opimibacter skivensis TaxID=2982028 RepID=A0A9D7XPA4_9BACT|nr:type II toxin-antitoxin system HicA family toxin [Candidatus Opimibacter skivensis]
MSKSEKLLAKLLQKPKDFTFDELVTVLSHFGYVELKKGKSAGSRRAFCNKETKHIIRLHKPHPNNELKMYQINEIIEELTKSGFI